MKTRESRLQNGIFVYKRGISLTKQESHLQNGILGVQTGLSGCYLPGGFSYYELGNRLLLDNEYLNPEVDIEIIREYIWYMETRTAHDITDNSDNVYFLGLHNDTAYYFNYEKDSQTVLDNDFLKTIKTKADAYVIYADTCNLSEAKMNKYSITFKKIPRDIARL